MTDEVLSLRPFVVRIDVSVELSLISMQVVLLFGPFNSCPAAEAWAGEVERLHKTIEGRGESFWGEAFEVVDVPSEIFLRSYVHGIDITQTDQGARKPGALIPVHTPEIDARDMHIYALHALHEAIHVTFMRLSDEDVE